MKTTTRARLVVAVIVIAALAIIGALTGSDPPHDSATATDSTTTTPAPTRPPTSPSSVARSTVTPSTLVPSTLAPTTQAPSTQAPSTLAQPGPAPTSVVLAPPATTAPPPSGPAATARWVLGGIPIKGRAPKTGYSRAQFGPAWTDDVDVSGGHNGCDTRNDILRRDLTDLTFRPGTRDCIVTTGVLWDPYTGHVIHFVRGQATSSAIQIDHVVPLHDAWQKGAQQLPERTRRNLANDPMNLLAVDGPTNQAKSDGDAATWLPPSRAFRCRYVALQTWVKARYHLWMTQAEHDAIARILAGCSDAQIGFIG